MVKNMGSDIGDRLDGLSDPGIRIESIMDARSKHAKNTKVQKDVLNSLCYRDMHTREMTIADAHRNTFQWAFETQFSLRAWLKNESGVYWVAGKAGSGKSTLMKFLHTHPTTKSALQIWAGDRKLVTASFFFTKDGSPLQKSQQGLLQGLLHSILRQNLGLIRMLCPARCHRVFSQDHSAEPWTCKELSEIFERLTEQSSFNSCFCFFIDGLDEYDGDVRDVIQILDRLTACPNIKICLSSRAENIFRDHYESSLNKLFLQDLTRSDIELYVRQRLANNEGFSKLKKLEHQVMSLTDRIIDRAEGVFLWVHLVVQSLLRGVSEGDDFSALEKRLDSLPSDLDEFYQRMLDSIEGIYRPQTSRILQICARATFPLTVVSARAAFNEFEHRDYAILAPIRSINQEELSSIATDIRKRLNAHCKDLLDVVLDESALYLNKYRRFIVRFLHRTVSDFIKKRDTKLRLKKWEPESFNSRRSICKAILAQLKTYSKENEDESSPDEIPNVFCHLIDDFALQIRCLGVNAMEQDFLLIDEVDRVMSLHWHNPNNPDISKHWISKIISPYWTARTYGQPSSPRNMLAWAIQERIFSYVKYKISHDRSLVKDCGSESLLLSGITRNLVSTQRPILKKEKTEHLDAEIVRLLFKHGADPNELQSSEVTAWTSLIQMLLIRSNRLENPGWIYHGIFFEIVKCFVENGAAEFVPLQKSNLPDLLMHLSCESTKALELLRGFFEEDEIDVLKQIQRKKMEEDAPSTVSRLLSQAIDLVNTLPKSGPVFKVFTVLEEALQLWYLRI